ncbi:MAG TPA: two-component regulator propeller domain-containing protein [Candidatus Acidoferrum sp.]|nr:two-component regulator propeller domain-containing protein [Candidatus Acidoferrum sp.]
MPQIRRKLSGAGLLLCAWALVLPAWAGAESLADSPFIVDVWTSREGLPENAVISVIQSRDGYLWLGTLNGLVRFDGNQFTVFNEYNTPGLTSDRVVYLFEDRHTNLWIGLDTAGVALAQDGKIKSLDLGRPGHEGRLVSACEDADGAVWLYSADARLGRYLDGKLETLDFNFAPLSVCRMIVAEKSGPLWVGESWVEQARTVAFLFSFRPSNFHPPALPLDQNFQVAKLDYLLAGQQGGTWRLINGRVEKWGAAQREKDFGPYPWGNATVTTACEDRTGNLIVGTLGAGVFWYGADGNYQQISTNEGLSSAYVLSACVDQQGNLWVGTDGKGLDRIKRKFFLSPAQLHSGAAQSVSADAAGGLWVTFGAMGASYWRTNVAMDFYVGRYQNAWTVLVDRRQRVWIGTWDEGLFRLETNRFQPVSGTENLGRRIFALCEDQSGQLWAGTQNGLARWNGKDWQIYTIPDGLVVRAIAADAESNLWVGTESRGLYHFAGDKFVSYPMTPDGVPGHGISCLYRDRDGALWVGTSGHGLARFHAGQWSRYATDDGLASNSIDYIIEDDEGFLWVGSNAGLMRLYKKSLIDFIHGKGNRLACRTYVETDGLPTRECSAGAQPAACRTDDGRLWFPTTEGVVSVKPADIKTNQQPPLILIESVLVDGQEQKTNRLGSAWRAKVTIPPGHEQLEIRYTGLNFAAPGEVRFKYRLEGHEAGWTDAGQARVAYYPNLPPGQYRFHVIAGNEDGVWNDTGAAVEVTAQPWFWQTAWFRLLVALLLAGLVVAVVRYLSTQKLRRRLQLHEQQEALERERSRIARDLHDQLGANLTQVALLGEMAETDKNAPAEVASHAQQISQTARETTRALDEIVWAANPSNDTLEGLVNYACKYAQEYLALAGVRYRADVPAQLPAISIPPEVRHNVFLAFKEAVNNVVKHAQASEVWIRLQLQPGAFCLSIEDNGRGPGDAEAPAAQMRNGLRNMRKRMEVIHGNFFFGPGTGGGTAVRLTVPSGKQI